MRQWQGLSFGRVAEEYERGRFEWPDAVLDGIGGHVVLDLAAGTGKLTRVLTRRYSRVIAVEPSDEMRALGQAIVPEARWSSGMAERIPLDDASVDAVFVAEALHWFEPTAAAQEIARVLRPGGTIRALFVKWDSRFEPPLPDAARQAVKEVRDRTGPTGGHLVDAGEWRQGYTPPLFSSLDFHTVPYEHVTDRDGVIAYYLSISPIAARPEDERDELRNRLSPLLGAHEYRLALHADVWTARRIAN